MRHALRSSARPVACAWSRRAPPALAAAVGPKFVHVLLLADLPQPESFGAATSSSKRQLVECSGRHCRASFPTGRRCDGQHQLRAGQPKRGCERFFGRRADRQRHHERDRDRLDSGHSAIDEVFDVGSAAEAKRRRGLVEQHQRNQVSDFAGGQVACPPLVARFSVDRDYSSRQGWLGVTAGRWPRRPPRRDAAWPARARIQAQGGGVGPCPQRFAIRPAGCRVSRCVIGVS